MEIGWVSSIDFVRVHDSKRVCVATAEHAALPEALKRALNIYPAPQSGTRCRRIANFINDIKRNRSIVSRSLPPFDHVPLLVS